MERISSDETRGHIIEEHRHRYQFAAQVAEGAVLDAACGIGYGSKILTRSQKVSSYHGVDTSTADIEYAKRCLASESISFSAGDISNLSMEDNSFDTIVSLETLEHVSSPLNALIEFSRVIKDDGLLIVSVPTRCYDELCEEVYGPNEFHLQKFSSKELQSLIEIEFLHSATFLASYGLGTLLWELGLDGKEQVSSAQALPDTKQRPLGSFLVVASKSSERLARAKFSERYYQGQSLVEYDATAVSPLRALIEKQDSIVAKKEEFLNEAADRYSQKETELREILARNEELATAYQNAGRMIKDRQAAINHLEALVNAREESLARESALNRGLDGAVAELEQKLRERDSEIEYLKSQLVNKEREFEDLERAFNQKKTA